MFINCAFIVKYILGFKLTPDVHDDVLALLIASMNAEIIVHCNIKYYNATFVIRISSINCNT